MKGYDSRAVANFFVAKSRADRRLLTIMQLLRLVYFAHGWYLGFTGKPLIHHRVEAWKFGPVVVEVYEAFRTQGTVVRGLAHDADGAPYAADFDENARDAMDAVYKSYGGSPALVLSELTHGDNSPWAASQFGGYYAPIPDEAIAAHYRGLIDAHKAREAAR